MYVILAFESDNCNRWSFLRLVSICSFIPAVLISSLCESCQILYEFNALCSNMHMLFLSRTSLTRTKLVKSPPTSLDRWRSLVALR